MGRAGSDPIGCHECSPWLITISRGSAARGGNRTIRRAAPYSNIGGQLLIVDPTRAAKTIARRRVINRTALGLLIASLVLAACACSFLPIGAPQTPTSSGKDFTVVAYQGQDVFGGQEVKFSNVLGRGKPIVLNFWGGKCPPCRAEMPEFQKVADDFAGKVTFVGIDVGPFTGLGTHDDAQKLLKDLGIRYPAGYAVDPSPLQPYGVRAMPTTVYISAKGDIVDTVNGAVREPQLRAAVQELLGAT